MLIVTGLAGAGKSVALNTLEDLGYYCIDNLPVNMLVPLVDNFAAAHPQPVAVAIDSRDPQGIAKLPEVMQRLRQDIHIQLLFLTANSDTLIRRFSQTRRPHPAHISNPQNQSLPDAIAHERETLGNIFNLADLTIDTSNYSVYRLKDKIRQLLEHEEAKLMITLQSFGFKHGTPINADFMFDVRFLPNPYWEESLRTYNGCEQPIIDYLSQYKEVHTFINNTAAYLEYCIPQFSTSGNRAYLTISIGCTGGQHRSVYSTEQIAAHLRPHFPGIIVEHRDMRSNK